MRVITRDRWDRKIAGVCGGLGRFLKVDPSIIRPLFVLVCICTGILPLTICYLIGWMIIPLGPPVYIQFECKKLYRSRSNRKFAGICGGMSDLMNIDATIIRLLVLFTMILTGIFPILTTYVVGAFTIPEQPEIK